MSRQTKTLIGLVTALLVLSGIATWDEWKTKQDEKDKETKGQILSIKPDQVIGLRLVSREDSDSGEKSATSGMTMTPVTDVVLKRDNNIWMIKSPVETKADQQVIADLLKSLTEYKSEAEVATSKSQWGAFGLESPRRRLDLELADGKSLSLLIGINAPVGFSVYAATTLSETVYSGSQYIATSTGKTLFDLREKKFLEVNSGSVNEAQITYPDHKILLSRAGGKWTIVSPEKTPADMSAVNNLLDDLTGLKATEFLDQPDQKFLAGASRFKTHSTWRLTLNDGVSLALAIYESGDALFVKKVDSGAFYKIGGDNKVKLRKSFNDLRDRRIFDFESGAVTEIKIDGESFKKKGADWVYGTDETKTATHVRGLLVDLEYAKAEAIFDATSKVSKTLPKSPLHTISIALPGKELALSAWDSAENKEMMFLKYGQNPNIYQIKKNLLANVAPHAVAPVGDELMPPTKP